MSKVLIVAENVSMAEVDRSRLTNDCHLVFREDGTMDIAKAHKMVDIFDTYYDLGILLQEIRLSGGVLNPKFNKPSL